MPIQRAVKPSRLCAWAKQPVSMWKLEPTNSSGFIDMTDDPYIARRQGFRSRGTLRSEANCSQLPKTLGCGIVRTQGIDWGISCLPVSAWDETSISYPDCPFHLFHLFNYMIYLVPPYQARMSCNHWRSWFCLSLRSRTSRLIIY